MGLFDFLKRKLAPPATEVYYVRVQDMQGDLGRINIELTAPSEDGTMYGHARIRFQRRSFSPRRFFIGNMRGVESPVNLMQNMHDTIYKSGVDGVNLTLEVPKGTFE